jgi:hypothetical protein
MSVGLPSASFTTFFFISLHPFILGTLNDRYLVGAARSLSFFFLLNRWIFKSQTSTRRHPFLSRQIDQYPDCPLV